MPRAWLSMFAVLLLALRLASPAGFMPGEAEGRFAIVACPEAVPAAHHQGHHGKAPQPEASNHCPFAAAFASNATLPDTVAPPVQASWSEPLAPWHRAGQIERSALFPPRPPSRAPPRA